MDKMKSRKNGITGMILLLCLVLVMETAVLLAGPQDKGPSAHNFHVYPGGVAPEPGKEPGLYLYYEQQYGFWSFSGDPIICNFSMSNLDTRTSLTLAAFPMFKEGAWHGGEIRVDHPGFRRHAQSKPAMPMEPVIFGPGKQLSGKFRLDEFGEIVSPGEGTIQLVLEVTDSAGHQHRIASRKMALKVAPVPRPLRDAQGKAIRAVASALESYFVDYSFYPPNQQERPFPRVPTALTSPVAYLRPEQMKAARDLAVFTVGSGGFCVAGQGPDRRWDITPAVQETNWDKLEWTAAPDWLNSLIRYAYDPTNGTNSSGDPMILSTFMKLHVKEQLKY